MVYTHGDFSVFIIEDELSSLDIPFQRSLGQLQFSVTILGLIQISLQVLLLLLQSSQILNKRMTSMINSQVIN